MSQIKTFSLIVFLLILAGIAGALLHKGTGLKSPAISEQAPATAQASSTQTPATQTLPAQAQAAESLASSTAPLLTRPVQYSAGLSLEVKNMLIDKIAKLRASLAKNYGDYGAWMNLALQYKAAGDHDAAREVWEYISRMYPARSTALHNLGDYYYHQLNDYAKAENYYRQAIQADPSQAIDYTSLFELYRDSYKQSTTAAADALKEGIAHISGNQVIDLYIALASYYEDKNDAADATTYYAKARDAAQKLGNTGLVAQIDAALASLKP